MKVQFTLTEDDYIAFNLYYARHDPAFMRRVRLIQAGGAVALIALGLFTCRFLRGGVTLEGMALFLIGALLFVLYVPNQAKSTIEKRVELTLDENRFQPQGERTLVLLDDALLIRDIKGEERVALDEIESTVRNKKHIFVLTKSREVVVIPLAAFETPDDAQNFYSGLPNARTLEK